MRHGFFRSISVIARRDFVATVYSKTYFFFLVGPLLIIGISFLFGSLGDRMAREEFRVRVAVIGQPAEFEPMRQARERLLPAFGKDGLPELVLEAPDYDLDLQTTDLLASRERRTAAVLTGGLSRPKLTGAISEKGSIRQQMGLILDEARQNLALGRAGVRVPPAEIELVKLDESAASLARMRAVTAQAGQVLLFMLTVFLSTMLLSNLVEEKSSKVIEVLAAAVPVDAIFMGKLLAMLAVSYVGILVWAAAVFAGLLIWPSAGGGTPEPAVGWPVFAILVVVYYTSNYLLLGALFLGIGAQASSVREVQTLSMPVTIGQMLVFFFAFFAVGAFNSLLGLAAAVFPFSSPLAMIARAAQTPELWPHLAALLWQALWVWLMIQLGAGLFRKNVLKSGTPETRRLRRVKA